MESPIVEIQNATVYRKETRVFNNLSLTIDANQTTAILGPNGAGKTTLLKLLTRELYPVVKENSFVKLFGNETVNLWELRKKIGLVSHEFQANFNTMANGLDVVVSAFFGSTGLHNHLNVEDVHLDKAQMLMETLGILDLKDRCFLKLSTGQQRRLLLARAMAHAPNTLILDEPTAGLDLAAAFQLISDMRNWAKNAKSLILVTHHVQEIIPEIQRVIFIKNGKVIDDGNKQALLCSEKLSSLYDIKLKVSESNGFYSVSPC